MKWFSSLFILLSLLFVREAHAVFFIEHEVGERNLYVQASFTTIQTLQSQNRLPTVVDSSLTPVTFAFTETVKKVLQPKKALASVVPEREALIHFAEAKANEYKINSKLFIATLKCESNFYSIQSRIPKKGAPNGREDSWGVAQIHLPAHPSVTREQALDPYFAINWAAEKFKKNPRIWTCFRGL